MLIHQNFTGGNIRIEAIEDNTIYLNNELRDTPHDWFYWAFCAENFAGKTITFRFPKERIGYYGPAVSHDLKRWTWLGAGEEENAFTYTFQSEEDKVYFAHSMLYHPDRFAAFAKRHNLELHELCQSKKGRSVPYITFGDGEEIVLLTARHHACESTGNYILEGILEGLLQEGLPSTKVICIPFTDFDGVMDGDQGKDRTPRDHNRDYRLNEPSIWPETAAIREIATNGIRYGFDFHSPFHCGERHDTVFLVEKVETKLAEYDVFSEILESVWTADALRYDKRNNILPGVEWNSPNAPTFACYMDSVANAKLACTLETAYFGTPDNIFTPEKAIRLGRCFAKAIVAYDKQA